MAKISDFIGEKIVKILSNKIDDKQSDFLFIFENGLRVYFECGNSPFFTGEGKEVTKGLDAITVKASEMFKELHETPPSQNELKLVEIIYDRP